MTSPLRILDSALSAIRPQGVRGWTRRLLPIGVVSVVFGLVVTASLAPPRGPSEADMWRAYLQSNSQQITVSQDVATPAVVRDGYSASPGIATLVAGGTNHDWAKLVLLLGGFPMTETNVTVFTRWMRQENGTDDWWNRNNPLNNSWGAPGAGGTGTNENLVVAAQNAADALHSIGGYSGIVDAFMASASTESIEQAIWASPWASGHYANGGHWSYAPVAVVSAPAGAWG
ncbi:hypothetical protein BH11ACT4_BH11ACT4_19630 [soil metagenome]